jgi:hypothetical protein
VRSAPEKVIGGVLVLVGLLAFVALAWVSRKLVALERALDMGDAVVMVVLALFAAFCVGVGRHLFSIAPSVQAPPAQPPAAAIPSRRLTLSQGCATAGVLLIVLSVLMPADWYPVVLLFLGLALLAVSHALTPCVERIEQLRRARDSMRQL